MAAPPITERHLPHFHRRSPMKEPVRVATTANITISTALNNGDTLDGVTLVTGDRVLVKDQSTGAENGIYEVSASPARAYDESTDDPTFGYLVYVIAGTANGGTIWKNTNTTPPTIGTTALTFALLYVTLTDPMTTRGDVIVRNASNVTARLAIGAAGKILSSDGTDPSWGNGPMTTQDDIIVGGTSGAPTRLAKGSDSQVLTVDPTTHHLVWATSSAGFTNPMTTKGDIIVGDTGGAAIRLAVGSDTQVLTADAASTGGIKWAAAGGGSSGALVLLEQHTASASASLSFTTWYSSTYDDYLVEFLGLLPATNTNQLMLRVSTNGGSSYDSGTNYSYSRAYSYPVAGAVEGASGATYYAVSGGSVDNTHQGVSGTVRLYDPAATIYKTITSHTQRWVASGINVPVTDVGGGQYIGTTYNAFQISFSSGNITSGTVRVYGITK